MRVVFDTNVVVSALTFDGTPRRLLNIARRGRFRLVLSRFILDEISAVLKRKFGWEEKATDTAIRKLSSIADILETDIRINIIKSDDSDNRILECGVSGGADIIVSGDTKHILPIKNYKGMKIIGPIEFLVILEKHSFTVKNKGHN